MGKRKKAEIIRFPSGARRARRKQGTATSPRSKRARPTSERRTPAQGRPSLASLAAEANRQADLADKAFGTAVEHAMQAGEALLEARARIPHGDWGQWLESNFSRSARSARAYVQAAYAVRSGSALPVSLRAALGADTRSRDAAPVTRKLPQRTTRLARLEALLTEWASLDTSEIEAELTTRSARRALERKVMAARERFDRIQEIVS